MIKLGILAADPFWREPGILASIPKEYEVLHFGDWKSYNPARLLEACRSVEVAITGRSSPRIPAEIIENPGRLKWLCHAHGTIRHLVERRHIEAGLIVTNWGDSVAGVAEGAMALLLCQLKQLTTLSAAVRGAPDERVYQGFPCTLDGRDVGLYGFGPIGRHMARMLQPFGANIAIYDPYARDIPPNIRRCESLRELFSTCQIISIHCGLNDQTRHSVNRALLDLLPQGGIVINTARGAIIVEEDLAALVKSGKLVAALDVIEHEGRWIESPMAKLPGAIMTWHTIGGGKGYPPGASPKPKLARFVEQNLALYAKGQPLVNVITAEEYDLKT